MGFLYGNSSNKYASISVPTCLEIHAPPLLYELYFFLFYSLTKIRTVQAFAGCTLYLNLCAVILPWNAYQYSAAFLSSPARLLLSLLLSKTHQE
jgi:hypothetical protein